MTIKVGSHGHLDQPKLHDGFVDGIRLTGEKALAISVRDAQGQPYTMQLGGTEALICTDFLLGNIIFDVAIVSGVVPDSNTLEMLFAPPHPSSAMEYHAAHAGVLERYSEGVRAGEFVLVTIDPSYGCKLIALCRKVSIS